VLAAHNSTLGPLIAPFWAALDGYAKCTNISYAYESDSKLVIRFSPAAASSYERGTYVKWELALYECGDFEIRVIDSDFDLSASLQGNVTIGWQDRSGSSGYSVCQGASCECRSLPLTAYMSSGFCVFTPRITGQVSHCATAAVQLPLMLQCFDHC
jgi:hypothetical protein